MSLHAVKILGISITVNPKKEILEYIQKYLEKPGIKPLIIVTPNAEQLVLAQDNPRFAQILNQADVAIPDGFPVARLLGVSRIAGVEFMEDLVSLASKRGYPIRLIGGYGDVAVKAFECLLQKYSGLTQSSQPRIVFVGLGAPKQEYYIEEQAKKNRGVIYMAVGGSFDVISGNLPRAPLIIRSIGFEWFWRLLLQPWRILRQLALVKFVFLVLKEKFS